MSRESRRLGVQRRPQKSCLAPMPTFSAISTKLGAVVRRGLPSLRNVVFARLGIWPVRSLADHWVADIPMFCINLSRDTTRRALVQQQVDKMGLRRFEFIDAVDARKLSMEEVRQDGRYDSAACRAFHPRDLTLNEIACSLSHAAAYERVVAEGHPWALILEDDVLFRSQRIARLQRKDIPDGIDIVFFNAFIDTIPPNDRVAGMIFGDTSYHGSAAAYLVSLSTAKRLLAAAVPVVHAADGLLGRVLSLPVGQSHAFRQQGVSLSLNAVIVYPEAVTNGSVEHYHSSAIRTK